MSKKKEHWIHVVIKNYGGEHSSQEYDITPKEFVDGFEDPKTGVFFPEYEFFPMKPKEVWLGDYDEYAGVLPGGIVVIGCTTISGRDAVKLAKAVLKVVS